MQSKIVLVNNFEKKNAAIKTACNEALQDVAQNWVAVVYAGGLDDDLDAVCAQFLSATLAAYETDELAHSFSKAPRPRDLRAKSHSTLCSRKG
jgi:hypothetical protein